MSKALLNGEALVQEYLGRSGLRVELFSKAEMGQAQRTPDFRVYSGNELAFYCEVKTAQPDQWLDGLGDDPTYNRVTRYIHSAVGQFDAVNPAMDRPNVLAIVNGDDEAEFTDLIQVLSGNAYCENGEVVPVFRAFSEGRIREEKRRVHLYLWFDEWKSGEPEMFFLPVHVAHHVAACGYFGVEAAK